MGAKMPLSSTLYCPVRGELNLSAKSKDNLVFTEEKRRIDCIKYLIEHNYPPSNIKVEVKLFEFGHKGVNSFRTDIVVFEIPVIEADLLSEDEKKERILLIAEIKRDNKDAVVAKDTQVKPALGFLARMDAIGIYWDDLEQQVFYKSIKNRKHRILEAGIAYLPNYGEKVEVRKLRYQDLQRPVSLTALFRKIENGLHPYVVDKAVRFGILFQLLLVKIFDEDANKKTNGIMILQDFSLFEISESNVLQIFNDTLCKALEIYQGYLPKKVDDKFVIPGSALLNISKLIAPINLTGANPEVIQDFYMYFAKELYKWDLAQYFTPYEVVDFIVQITNPQYGDTIKDPACGSADFLISAHRRGSVYDEKMGDKIYGSDNSPNAVQISVLNMILNGDGKSHIVEEDSLARVNDYANRFSIMLCNPPFGVRIQERRAGVLANFDLGREKTSQQTGILFGELVVKQAKPGGRIALIVPNGYLGNKSEDYYEFRRWLLLHTKIACIISFPRFTFKKSGADVSASVIILEKRLVPLEKPDETEQYNVYVNLLESVGWDIGNKTSKKIYKQSPESGVVVLDENNEPVLDADFSSVLQDLYKSPVIMNFPWIATNVKNASPSGGWAVPIRYILSDPFLLLDPKRLCRKYQELRNEIQQLEHFCLMDVCDIMPEGGFRKVKSRKYKYVELGNVNESNYEYTELMGWQLPSRAKHKADPDDIFIGSVWGSVKKWFIAGTEAQEGNLLVTNGFYRLKMKPGKEEYLPDVMFALSSEFYRVQMRALATGSDGLAVVGSDDLGKIYIPRLVDKEIRTKLEEYIDTYVKGTGSIQAFANKNVPKIFKNLNVKPRKTNFSQV
jgi:type I restriction enzyme M protein